MKKMKIDTKFIIKTGVDWECNVNNQDLLIEVILLFNGGFIGYHRETKQCLLFKSPKLEDLTKIQIDYIIESVDPTYFNVKKELSVYESNVMLSEYVCKIDFWIENYHYKRQESMFYQGDIINCTVNGKTFNARATGEIRVQLDEVNGTGNEEDFTTYKNSNATDEFLRRGYTDKDLSELEFDNNNWFTIDICDNEVWQENDKIEDTFDDCIEELINFLNGEIKWI